MSTVVRAMSKGGKKKSGKNDDDPDGEHAVEFEEFRRQATENLHYAVKHADLFQMEEALVRARNHKVDEEHIALAMERRRELQMIEAPQVQRGCFTWVGQQDEQSGRKPLQHETISILEVARRYGVPEDKITKHVQEEIAEAEACQSLPFTLLMVVTYTVMTSWHDNNVAIFAVEEALVYDVDDNSNHAGTWPDSPMAHKGLEDVNSVGDFWSWMIQGYVSLLWGQEPGFSEGVDPEDPETWLGHPLNGTFPSDTEPFPRAERGSIMNYNMLIGGVRFRQQREEHISCRISSSLAEFFNTSCVGHYGAYQLDPEYTEAFLPTRPDDEFWFWIHDDIDIVTDHCIALEADGGWIDELTTKVEIAQPMYNSEHGVFSLVTVNFYFSRGGHIWKRIVPLSTHANWFHGIHSLVADLIWLVCLLWIVITEVRKMRSRYGAFGWHGVWEYLQFYVLIDWISVAVGTCVILNFTIRVAVSASLVSFLAELALLDEVDNRELFRSKTAEFTAMLEEEVHHVYWFRVLVGVYPMVVVLRLFKAFAAQPRLSIVTKTLSGALVDLLHFMLVFFSVFVSFAVAGVLLFGRDSADWTTFYKSMSMTFRMMMGDFDWDALAEVGRIRAAAWFLAFNVFISLLMLNMLMAIVMDSYALEKSKLGDAETLLAEGMQFFTRMRGLRKGTMVHLSDVLKGLKKYRDEGRVIRNSELEGSAANPRVGNRTRNVDALGRETGEDRASLGSMRSGDFASEATAAGGGKKNSSMFMKSARSMMNVDQFDHTMVIKLEDFLEIVPKLKMDQAEELMCGALGDFYQQNKEDANIDEMSTCVRKMNFHTKQLKKKIHETLRPDASDDTQTGGVIDVTGDHDNYLDEGMLPAKPELVHMPSERTIETHTGNKARSFVKELNKSYIQMSRATGKVGTVPASDKLAPIIAESSSTLHGLTSEVQQTREVLSCLDDVSDWSLVQIVDDPRKVLAACRICGLNEDNDLLRHQAAGRVARVVARDPSDSTVKCHVPEVGDVWLGVRALTRLDFSQSAASLPPTGGKLVRQGSMISGAAHRELQAHEHEKRRKDLSDELRVGRQTIAESMTSAAELEDRLRRERAAKTEEAVKFQTLKKQVKAMSLENHQLQEKLRESKDQQLRTNHTRDEYYNIVKQMLDENDYLKGLIHTIKARKAHAAFGGGQAVLSEYSASGSRARSVPASRLRQGGRASTASRDSRSVSASSSHRHTFDRSGAKRPK